MASERFGGTSSQTELNDAEQSLTSARVGLESESSLAVRGLRTDRCNKGVFYGNFSQGICFFIDGRGFALVSKGKLKTLKSVSVVTIRSEFEAKGKPVVVYKLDEGALFEYEKLTATPKGENSLVAWLALLRAKVRIGQVVRTSDRKTRLGVTSLASQADLLTGLYKLELKTLDKAILAKQAYVLLFQSKENYLRYPKKLSLKRKVMRFLMASQS